MDASESWSHLMRLYMYITRHLLTALNVSAEVLILELDPPWLQHRFPGVPMMKTIAWNVSTGLYFRFNQGTQCWWLDHVHKAILLLLLSTTNKTDAGGGGHVCLLKITIKLNFYHRLERSQSDIKAQRERGKENDKIQYILQEVRALKLFWNSYAWLGRLSFCWFVLFIYWYSLLEPHS